jgi:hypothetical protein
MRVDQLIALLQAMPQDANVFNIWDGAPRTAPELVWLSRKGDVMLCDYREPVYEEGFQPIDVPSGSTHWETGPEPKGFKEALTKE